MGWNLDNYLPKKESKPKDNKNRKVMVSKTKTKYTGVAQIRFNIFCEELIKKMNIEQQWWEIQEESCAIAKNYTGAQKAKSMGKAIKKTIELLNEKIHEL